MATSNEAVHPAIIISNCDDPIDHCRRTPTVVVGAFTWPQLLVRPALCLWTGTTSWLALTSCG